MATLADRPDWNNLRPRLFGYIQARIREAADAEDVLQEVILRIHQRMHQVRNPAQHHAWAFQIARNAVADYHRQHEQPPASPLALETPVQDESDAADPTILSCIQQNLGRLPAKYREAVLLADVQGMKQKDIAVRLGLSLPGAKSRIQRGRDQLREVVGERCNLEFDRYGAVVTQECRNATCACCSAHSG